MVVLQRTYGFLQYTTVVHSLVDLDENVLQKFVKAAGNLTLDT
jgi:hypothetical protein